MSLMCASYVSALETIFPKWFSVSLMMAEVDYNGGFFGEIVSNSIYCMRISLNVNGIDLGICNL